MDWTAGRQTSRQTELRMMLTNIANVGLHPGSWWVMAVGVVMGVVTGVGVAAGVVTGVLRVWAWLWAVSRPSCTWVAADEAAVQRPQLLPADVPGGVVGGLEVQVVLPAAVELRGGHVHPHHDLVRVSGLLDGRLQQLQSYAHKHPKGLLSRQRGQTDRAERL